MTRDVQKGYLKLLILMLLARKQMHGYEIMEEITERTLGLLRPTPGGVYPLLRRMERRQEVRARWFMTSGRRRRIYQITSEGRVRLNRALEKQKALIDTIDGLHSDLMAEVLETDRKLSDFPMFSLLREAFSYEGSKAKTVEEKRSLLLSIRKHLRRSEEMINSGIKEIDRRLKQIDQSERKRRDK